MRVLPAIPASLTVAVGFLTRLPVGGWATAPSADVAASAVLFPIVGAAIGAVVGGTAIALALTLPALLAASLAVALELLLTGALHVDGLADSADGLAGRDRDHALEIMRDHSLGAYGASALTLDLVVKIVALAALADSQALWPVVAAYAASRAAPLPLAAALPNARAGAGTGRLLAGATPLGALGAIALAGGIATAAVGAWAVAAILCLALVVAAVGTAARRRLGGITGDVMGAAIELTATLALIVAVAAQG
jgi:adenosylcobinamide-GDP ribazoletransferase